jgi:5-methylcytosine-specific restriction endonuclease McrA
MDFITSKGSELPKDITTMESSKWFNVWERKNFPYYELLPGDNLYWFDTSIQKIVWKTEVLEVLRFPYSDKKEILERYGDSMTKHYYESRPEKGYFIGYKVKVLEELDIEKPRDYRFPQLGWLRIDDEVSRAWFNKNIIEDSNTLDDSILDEKKSIAGILSDLNEKMQNVKPERVEKVILTTIRKDTKIIQAIKEASQFRCQFPYCGKQIAKKNGGFYIEVAHVKPVSQNGQSVLGNLIVLCPNHHKEFDFGDLEITEQTNTKLSGILNSLKFEIGLTYCD